MLKAPTPPAFTKGLLMEDADQKILYSLADTMSKTRDELDAMRCVLIAITNVLAANPQTLPLLTETLKAVIESDSLVALFSTMTDEQIQRRIEWIARLVPLHLRQSLGPNPQP